MIGETAPRRVLFFGDSLVAGVGDPTGGGWVARLVSVCSSRGTALTAYNLGIRGETSTDVAARWRAEAVLRIPSGGDARMVLSFGANDTTMQAGALRTPADASRRALIAILEGARAMGLATYVVGPAPVDDPAQNRRLQDLTDAFAEACRERDIPFVNVLMPLLESATWMSEMAAGDGAHPGAAGYDAFARLLIGTGLPAWLTTPTSP